MTDNEIAIAVTSKVCGVPKRKILSASKEWEAVEARMLIVLVLSADGKCDERIGWALHRKRGAILKSRHNGHKTLDISKTFKTKYEKIHEQYKQQKSLRMLQG